ncbi:MAG: hypothetical protein AB9879_11880 [Methanothrix sp.]
MGPIMICLRCGNCCRYLDIFVINPRSILPDGTLDPHDPESMIFKPAGDVCPHFICDRDVAVCTIHHLPCYQGTPCRQFELLGPEEQVCMMGGYFEHCYRNSIEQPQE